MQAATIAQERAHAHSRSMCWHYVKEALLASGAIDSRPKSELAKDAAQDLVSNYGFKDYRWQIHSAAPVGSVLVYGANRAARSRRDPHQGRFRQRLPFENAVAPSFARRLREVVIFRELRTNVNCFFRS